MGYPMGYTVPLIPWDGIGMGPRGLQPGSRSSGWALEACEAPRGVQYDLINQSINQSNPGGCIPSHSNGMLLRTDQVAN